MIARLRTKIVLIATITVLLAIAAIVASSGYFFKQEYSKALESRSLLVAKHLKVQLERIQQYGITLQDLTGFDEQAEEAVRTNEGIDYAFVVDPGGRVLFRSNSARIDGVVADPALLNAIRRGAEGVIGPSSGRSDEYNAVVPLFAREGLYIGSIVVGFPAGLIADEVNGMLRLGAGAGLAALIVGLVVLLAALSFFVTGPLTALIGAIEQIRRSEDISLRVPGRGRDEIGVLIGNFNAMLDEIEQRAIAKNQADAAKLEYEKELQYRATHDVLTGLPNRNLLNDRLERLLAHSRRTSERLAVLFLDLDRFKFVNDSFGHAVGDALLKAVADRLQAALRESDTVARLGGDEFVILLSGLSDQSSPAQSAQKVLAQFAEPFEVAGHTIHTGTSIGVSVYPEDGESADVLLRHADASMYRAKEQGRNQVRFYTAEMGVQAQQRVVLENALRVALERNELELHYQPKICLTTGAIMGVEALTRWHNPELGLVPPDRFIPLAEESGLIAPIGEWVLKTACAQLAAWHAAGARKLSVSVNLSARQFQMQAVTELVRGALAQTVIPAACLDLEITESVMLQEGATIVDTLRELHAIGVTISLDDFGTGYSSLGYLKRLPLDVIKIDRSFTRDVTVDAEDAAITRAIIAMAHSLGMKTVAEGVETEAQVAFLKAHGCDAAQGYYYGRPRPAAELHGLLFESGARIAAVTG